MIIKVLGGGCANCEKLEQYVEQALEELNIEAVVEKVQQYEEIASYGVMTTPALVINEKVVATGKLRYKKVKRLVEDA